MLMIFSFRVASGKLEIKWTRMEYWQRERERERERERNMTSNRNS